MILLRSKTTITNLNKLKIDEVIELDISDSRNNTSVQKWVVKIIKAVEKKIVCGEHKSNNGCGIDLSNKPYREFYHLKFCLDCYDRQVEKASKKSMGQKPSPLAFKGRPEDLDFERNYILE